MTHHGKLAGDDLGRINYTDGTTSVFSKPYNSPAGQLSNLPTFSGFCSCPFTGLGFEDEPPHPEVCTALRSCHARRASRSRCSSRQIQSGCVYGGKMRSYKDRCFRGDDRITVGTVSTRHYRNYSAVRQCGQHDPTRRASKKKRTGSLPCVRATRTCCSMHNAKYN